MDKIQKALQKLSIKERELVKSILTKLYAGNLQGLDLVKLKSHKDIFRIKNGKLRIIFRMRNNIIFVLAIERRSEHTYRNF
jgi:mRNA-degrading endonuclease RelE of RelBE toxin-antitoxin system